MPSEERARAEERLAEIEESTEQRMHSVAELLPDGDRIHERANRLTERAEAHHEHAQEQRAAAEQADPSAH